MKDISKYISGLSANEFELLKLFLDKIVAAFLIGIAGILFYFLLERYKSSLVKNLEITKYHIPRVAALLDEAESLYKLSLSVINKLSREFTSYSLWKSEIINIKKKITFSETIPMNHTSKDFILNPTDKQPISVYELLYNATDNKNIQTLLNDDRFWNDDKQYKEFEGFIWNLNFLLEYPTVTPSESDAIFNIAMINFFADNSDYIKIEYYEKLNDFRHKIMINLNADSRKQKNITKKIIKSMNLSSDTIKCFPKNDAIKLIEDDICAISVLTKCYAALLTQIKLYAKYI